MRAPTETQPDDAAHATDEALVVETPAPARVPAAVVPALVAGLVAALAHFTWNGFFLYDDYIYLRQAQRAGPTPRFLVQPLNLHFSPGHRLVDWVLARWFPLDFGLAQVLLLACFAASLVLLHRVLVELFGDGPGPVLLMVLYGTSVVHVGITQWWASGLQSLPSTVLSLASVLAYLRYRRTGRRRLLHLSVAAFSVGLLFYIKPILVPLYLVLLRVLILEPERSVRESLTAALGEWRDWLLYAVPVGIYAIGYLVWYWRPSGMASPYLLARFFQVSWARVFLPSLLGFRVSTGHTSARMDSAILLAQVATAAVVVATVVRRPRAWRAWAFFGVVFLANGLAIGLARLGIFGTLVAYSYRYWQEVTYLFPVALGAAVLGFPERNPAGRWREHQQVGRRAVAGTVAGTVLGAGLAVHLVLAWRTAGRIAGSWNGRLAAAYVHRAEDSLHRLAAVGIRPTIVDGVVPDDIMPAWMTYGSPVGYNRYSEFFRLIDPALRFDRPARALYAVRADGSLTPARFVPEIGGVAPALVRTGALVVTAGTMQVGREGVCVSSGPSPGSIELSPPSPHSDGDGYARLLYSSNTGGRLTLFVDRGDGYRFLDQRAVTIARPGQGADLSNVGGPTVDRLRIDTPVNSRVCLHDVQLGHLAPGGTAGAAVPAGSPLLDPFDRDDSSSELGRAGAGGEWRAESGTWGVLGGQAYVPGPTGGRDIAVIGPARPGTTAAVVVTRVSRLSGLVFAYRDPSDYWAVLAAPDYATWGVVHVVDGKDAVVGNTGFTPTDDGTTVGVRLHDASADVTVDGRIMTTVPTGPIAPTDSVGMVTTGADAAQARFADFSLVPPPRT